MKSIITLLFFFLLNIVHAQVETNISVDTLSAEDTHLVASENFSEVASQATISSATKGLMFVSKTDLFDSLLHNPINTDKPLNKKRLRFAIGTAAAIWLGGMSFLHFEWYNGRKRQPFHFHNDLDGYLQMDKFGHAYGSYIESYIGYHWLRSVGVKRKKALIYGGFLGLAMQVPIEIWDGMYDGWGFSQWDMVANALGSSIVVGNELLFQEQLVKYKLSFSVSEYSKPANGYLGTTIFSQFWRDYNAYTFWLSAPINKVLPIKKAPNWLNLAVGYSANGMYGMFKNINYNDGVYIPQTERYRQYLLSLDIDWTRIPTKSKFMKGFLTALTFIKLPFPALEFSKNSFKGHWMYY